MDNKKVMTEVQTFLERVKEDMKMSVGLERIKLIQLQIDHNKLLSGSAEMQKMSIDKIFKLFDRINMAAPKSLCDARRNIDELIEIAEKQKIAIARQDIDDIFLLEYKAVSKLADISEELSTAKEVVLGYTKIDLTMALYEQFYWAGTLDRKKRDLS